MALLSKDIYDKKASWAAKRMAENKKISTLTEEQHDALNEIASIRHNLHVSSGGNPSRYDYKGYVDFFGATYTDSKGKIYELIEDNNLPDFIPYLKIDEFTYLGGDEWNEDEIDGYEEDIDYDSDEYEKKYDAYLNIILRNVEKLDQSVRDYLAYVDYLYGTNYSPSRGIASIYIEKNKVEKMNKGGNIKKTTDGKKGGILYGKSHAKGGIKAVITDAGNKEVELEGGEAVVKKSALKDKTVKTLTGTNAEILNMINTRAGGNPIYAPSEVKMKNGGSVGSDSSDERYLTTYFVWQRSNNHDDLRYSGLDEETAERTFKIELGKEENSTTTLEKKVDKYLFVGELDEEIGDTIEDYPIEDWYNDSNTYQLIEEGEVEIVKDEYTEKFNKKTDELIGAIQNRIFGNFKSYNSIEMPNGEFLEVRIKDHSANRANFTGDHYLSFVIANVDATKRFKQSAKGVSSNREFYFDDSQSEDEIVDAIRGEIDAYKEEYGSDGTMANGGSVGSDILSPYLENLKVNGIVLSDEDLVVLMYNEGKHKRSKGLYSPTILRKYLSGISEELANQLTIDLAMEFYDLFNEKDIPTYLKHNRIIIVNNTKVVFDNKKKMAEGGSVGGAMLAPNGQPSNLTPEQYKLVRTPAFKAWFGDWEKLAMVKIKDSAMDEVTLANLSKDVSKVVDENGEPLVVYHGTNTEFYEFDLKYFGKTDEGFFGKGFYFSTDMGTSETYAKISEWDKINNTFDKNGVVLDCFLNLKNPFIVKSKMDFINASGKREIRDGYDGKIIIPYSRFSPNTEYIAFYPNQIKLADGTNTTFDSDSNDIRYKEGGSVGGAMLAPNGQPSNLTPEQYKLVRTPAFKAWFGDWENDPQNASKVVDENGEPLLVYHFSRSDEYFYSFKNINSGGEIGIHFGNKEQAKKNVGDNNYIEFEVFINIRNPLLVEDIRFWNTDYIQENILIPNKIKYKKSKKGYMGSQYATEDDILESLADYKIDGFIYPNEYEGEGISYSVFYSNQIKLADGTNTTFDSNSNDIRYKEGGNITPSAISKMTKAEQKAFYKTKEGKALDKETYSKWKSLVNMSKGELESFYNSKEGKEAGLSAKEAKAEGIDSGRESARWIMKMKDIPYTEWTSKMWIWAKKQISFVSRMKGMRGDLYDDKGNKTRKHLALLIWGHNPKKMAEGGVIPQQGTLFTKDKKNKLDYRKVGNDYVFKVYDVETNPVENYTHNQSKKRNDDEAVMDYNQFINYLYSELYIDDKKMAEGGNVGEVTFTDYKGEQIMFEPHNNEYFVIGNDENIFKSMEEAKQFIDNPNGAINTEFAKMAAAETEEVSNISVTEIKNKINFLKSILENKELPQQRQDLFDKLYTDSKNGILYNKVKLEATAKSFGITDANIAKEVAEYTIVNLAREISLGGGTVKEKYDSIVELYKNQVNLSHRTSESIMYQQYSTPAPLGYLMGVYCGMDKKGEYFEPSAGNGLLTVASKPSNFIVNDVDDNRNLHLSVQGYKNVLKVDASQPFAEYEKKFDAIITNPPFGTAEIVKYGNSDIRSMEQIMALRALDTMKDLGKAAIIIGGHTIYDKEGRIQAGKNRTFFVYLYKNYYVEDVINIDGHNLYSRQGTAFNTRIILINGRKKEPNGFPPLVKEKTPPTDNHSSQIVSTFDELYTRIMKLK